MKGKPIIAMTIINALAAAIVVATAYSATLSSIPLHPSRVRHDRRPANLSVGAAVQTDQQFAPASTGIRPMVARDLVRTPTAVRTFVLWEGTVSSLRSGTPICRLDEV